MKECLNCTKEYEPKRDTSKFCSTNCRVLYHQKHGKSKIKPAQMQELYNSFMAAIAKLELQPPPSYFQGPETATIVFRPPDPYKAKIKRPFLTLQALIDECESVEEYAPLRKEIEEADHLTSKEKSILLRKK